MKHKDMDITGIRYGRLVALQLSHISENFVPFWDFKCDCGKIKKIRIYPIIRGTAKSCGCLRTDLNRLRIKEINKNRSKNNGGIEKETGTLPDQTRVSI